MRRCQQVASADWLVHSEAPWWQLATFGPRGFEAYARLRYIPDPQYVGQAEADVPLPEDHPPEIAQARRALLYLERFTDTGEECFFCVWDGYSGSYLDPALTAGPLVTIPNRRYVLFAGRLTEINQWEHEFGQRGACAPPAFVWPADRRWCFAGDVDPHWAGIGADRAAIDTLVAASDIDVVRADPTLQPPAYA